MTERLNWTELMYVLLQESFWGLYSLKVYQDITSKVNEMLLIFVLLLLKRTKNIWTASRDFENIEVFFCDLQWALVSQMCPTLCDPMIYSPPGSSFHGIFQARVSEWVTILFSRGSSWPRDQTQISCVTGRFFTSWTTREAPLWTTYQVK